MQKKPKIAISLGDPKGIGPEVLLKALADFANDPPFIPQIYGPRELIEAESRLFTPSLSFTEETSNDSEKKKIKIYQEEHPSLKGLSKNSDKYAAISSLFYFQQALKSVIEKRSDALVTAPLNKQLISDYCQSFSGHTEYLAKTCRVKKTTMAFYSNKLIVALATTHLPIKKISSAINEKDLIKTIENCHNFLKLKNSIGNGKIAVCGLNPHAGQDTFSFEEEKIIAPAIASCQKRGIKAVGPFPADTLFYRLQRGEFTAAVAIYHDQALIPLKLLDFFGAVNVTLGLPIIRTSPAHGVAYDLKGKGLANFQSMKNALLLASELATKRKEQWIRE